MLIRAATSGALSSQREVVDCLATLCGEFPGVVSSTMASLAPDVILKLVSVVEATMEAATEPTTVAACADMLRVFAEASEATGKLAVLADAGLPELALRLARNYLQDSSSSIGTIASSVALCASLCGPIGSPSPAGKRAIGVHLAGDSIQLLTQAVQTHCLDAVQPSGDVLGSLADWAGRLCAAVIAEDGSIDAPDPSPRLLAVGALVKRIVAAAAYPSCSASAVCMEHVLNLVVVACDGTEGSGKVFSDQLLAELAEVEIRKLLVTAMSSVSVSEAVLKVGRRATALLDGAAGATAASSDSTELAEGLVEVVTRLASALPPSSNPAALTAGLAELLSSLRILSASLVGEERVDDGVLKCIVTALLQACTCVAKSTAGTRVKDVNDDVFVAQRDVVSLCAQSAGRLFTISSSSSGPVSLPLQVAKYCGKSGAALPPGPHELTPSDVVPVLDAAVGVATNWNAKDSAAEHGGLCAVVYEGLSRSYTALVQGTPTAVVPLLLSESPLALAQLYTSLLDAKDTAAGAWQSLRALRSVLLELSSAARNAAQSVLGGSRVPPAAYLARWYACAAAASIDAATGDFTGSAAAPNDLTQSATAAIAALATQADKITVTATVFGAIAEVQTLMQPASDSRALQRKLAAFKEASRVAKVRTVCGTLAPFMPCFVGLVPHRRSACPSWLRFKS